MQIKRLGLSSHVDRSDSVGCSASQSRVYRMRCESVMQAAVFAIIPVVVRYLSEIIAALGADVKVTAALDRRDYYLYLNLPGRLFQILFLFAFFGQSKTRRSNVAILLSQKPF